jgi:hypothetical protein
MQLTLRTYQARAIEELRRVYRNGATAPLLVMPTGAGKTVVFAEIVRNAAERGNRVLILAHRRELVQQASNKLKAAGVDHGIIASGITTTPSKVQVASVQTLVRHMAVQTWQPDLIIIDEAHHACAGSWSKVVEKWPDALRLGVTATPMRLDGKGLAGTFDSLVLGPTVSALIHDQYLVRAQVYAPPVVADLSKLRTQAGDYSASDSAAQMDKPTVTGDAIEHYRRLADGRPAIAFCCSTIHAEHVASSFRAAGFRSSTLLGTTSIKEREQILSDFANGKLDVISSVDVISEGFDCPGATVAILLRPTKSEALYLQQVGRVLRPAPGKPHALVLDHVGNVHRHGFPDDTRDYSLADRPKRGGRGGESVPFVRQCSVCYAAFPPQPVCPCCGTEIGAKPRIIKEVDGTLILLNGYEIKTFVLVTKTYSAKGYEDLRFRFEIGAPVMVSGFFSPDGRGWKQAILTGIKDPKGLCEPIGVGVLEFRSDSWITRNQVQCIVNRDGQDYLCRPDQLKTVKYKNIDVNKARTLTELLKIEKQRGYKPGWAYRLHSARQSRHVQP